MSSTGRERHDDLINDGSVVFAWDFSECVFLVGVRPVFIEPVVFGS